MNCLFLLVSLLAHEDCERVEFHVEPREVHVVFILVCDLYQYFGFPQSVVTATLSEWVGMAATLYPCI